MMRQQLYEIVVREVVTDLDDDGTTPALSSVAESLGEEYVEELDI